MQKEKSPKFDSDSTPEKVEIPFTNGFDTIGQTLC